MTRPGGGGDSHRKGPGCSSYLLGVKKAVLVPLRVFSLKSSTAGALGVPFRLLSKKIMTGGI